MLTNAAGAWASGALGASLGLARLTAGAVLLGALALLAGASGVIALFPIFAMTAFAWSALQPHVAGYLSRRTEASQRATVLSLMSFVPGLFGIGAALAVAPLIDEAGLAATLSGAAILLAALGLVALLAWTRTGDTTSEPPVKSGA